MREVATLTREGLARAGRAWRLVLLVWLLHLVLAVAAAFPLWRVLRAAVGALPEADVLRTGVALGALADLAEMRPGLDEALAFTLVAAAAVGLLLGSAVTGGVLEVLLGRDGGTLGQRFGRGAGRFFGRFFRLTLVVGVLAAVVGGAAVLPFLHLTRSYLREGWEPGRFAPLGAAGVAGVVALLTLLLLDASRIHIVRSDGGVWSGLREGLRLVLGRPLVWAGTWVANALLVGLAVAVFVVFRQTVPTEQGVLILAMGLAQQALALTRTALRVALLGSESSLVERLQPSPRPVVAVSAQAASSSPAAV
jgi:hypothetical protein